MPKHLYLSQEEKGALLTFVNNGEELLPAAKKLKINPRIARSIKNRADKIIIYNNEYNLLLPSLHDRVSLAPKLGRPYILSEVDMNTLD